MALRKVQFKKQFVHNLDSVMKYSKIFIPNNVKDDHWTMYVIFIEEKTIAYYDSFNEKPPTTRKPEQLVTIIEQISSIERIPFKREDWTCIQSPCVPQVSVVIMIMKIRLVSLV